MGKIDQFIDGEIGSSIMNKLNQAMKTVEISGSTLSGDGTIASPLINDLTAVDTNIIPSLTGLTLGTSGKSFKDIYTNTLNVMEGFTGTNANTNSSYTYFGKNVMSAVFDTDMNMGVLNTIIGYKAGYCEHPADILTHDQNTIIGHLAGVFDANSNDNVLVGRSAFGGNSSGDNNTILGSSAGSGGGSGDDNVLVGYGAGYKISGDSNVIIGSLTAANGFAGYTISNTLWIHNADADQNNVLIYGEFDNSILRINGKLEINNTSGATYNADYSSNYTNRSLVDKAYVDSYYVSGFTDGAPTNTEIVSVLGTAASRGAGFKATLKDNTGTLLTYFVVSDGTDWYYTTTTKAT